MHTQFSRHGNGSAEPEDDVQEIDDERQEGVDGEALSECGGDKVEEREHAEDRDEHAVIDNRWVATISVRDHVSDQGHDEERPEELVRCQR